MLESLSRKATASLQKQTKTSDIVDWLDVDEEIYNPEPILLPWQIEVLTDEAPVKVLSKGRQIGFSNICGLYGVLLAISNKKDTVINSYNMQAAREFLRAVVYYAKIFNQVFNIITDTEIIENSMIGVMQLTFNNGKTITSVSGDTTNLRGKSGALIILDEIAYRDTPISEILEAANGTLIHGGEIIIGSTHCGIDSDFDLFIQKIDSGELPYTHYHIPFMVAVNQGLYKRICQKNGKIWTQQKQDEWVKTQYETYGIGARQELDAIPSNFKDEGDIFSSFKFVKDFDYGDRQRYLQMRYIDLAASTNESSYYTASIHIIYDVVTSKIIIKNWFAERLLPSDGDDAIIELVKSDSKEVITVLEIEPGSTSLKYIEMMRVRLQSVGFDRVDGYRPLMSKLQRLIPVANAVKKGDVVIIDTPENHKLATHLVRVCNKKMPLISDLGDCLSGIYDYALNKVNVSLFMG